VERIKNMGLKKAFFLLAVMCLLGSLLLTAAVWAGCSALRSAFPAGGIAFGPDGMITYLEEPTGEQRAVSAALGYIQIFSCILFPVCGLAGAGALFYRLKCRAPIMILQEGVLRIRKQDLDFAIPVVSDDELGQLCAAFETMRAELLKSNQELWRQAEERKRLNAAFSHDLRNPVTVLKGTVKQLRQGTADEQALSRLESYTLRIEQYVEVMGSIQRLEQMPVCKKEVSCAVLLEELEETARLLAPKLKVSVCAGEKAADTVSGQQSEIYNSAPGQQSGTGTVLLDYGLFLTVAENLLGNAARFAEREIALRLGIRDSFLTLSVRDDGPGYPAALVQDGPKPF
jgi:signal transduction histidine kinase